MPLQERFGLHPVCVFGFKGLLALGLSAQTAESVFGFGGGESTYKSTNLIKILTTPPVASSQGSRAAHAALAFLHAS